MHTSSQYGGHYKFNWRPFVFDLDESLALIPDLALGISNGRDSVAIWRGKSVLFCGQRGICREVALNIVLVELQRSEGEPKIDPAGIAADEVEGSGAENEAHGARLSRPAEMATNA